MNRPMNGRPRHTLTAEDRITQTVPRAIHCRIPHRILSLSGSHILPVQYTSIANANALNGWVTRFSTFPAAVYPATTSAPCSFRYACRIMIPTAVNGKLKCHRNSDPQMGERFPALHLQISFSGLNTGYRFTAYRWHATAETSWDITVASAAPPTPLWKPRIMITSRTTFRTDEMIRK